jgi:ubiquinone/menaquinone biosynthesis C-methylase UbiE
MSLFRPSTPIDLPVSIAGIVLGNRLLIVGCGDPGLIAKLAVKTGLTGRACAIDESEPRRARAASIAEQEGALVETMTSAWTGTPFDQDSFDVVVVRGKLSESDPAAWVAGLSEAARVLRKGGRCLTIDGEAAGRFTLFRRRGIAGPDVVGAFEAAGFRAVRVLAERDGQLFVEGVKGT